MNYKHFTFYLSEEALDGIKKEALNQYISASKLIDLYGLKLRESQQIKKDGLNEILAEEKKYSEEVAEAYRTGTTHAAPMQEQKKTGKAPAKKGAKKK